jgi:hypothetical protein
MYLSGLFDAFEGGIQEKLYDAARASVSYFNEHQNSWSSDVRQVFSSRLDQLNVQSINPDLDVDDLVYLIEDYENLLREMNQSPTVSFIPEATPPPQPPKEIPSIPSIPGSPVQPQVPVQAGLDPMLLLGIAGLAYLFLKEKR